MLQAKQTLIFQDINCFNFTENMKKAVQYILSSIFERLLKFCRLKFHNFVTVYVFAL